MKHKSISIFLITLVVILVVGYALFTILDGETTLAQITTPEVAPTEEATLELTPEITPEATSVVSPIQNATPEVFATQAVTPDLIPEQDGTPEAAPTEDVINISPDGEYWVTISYAIQDFIPEAITDPPSGTRWMILVATLANMSAEPVEVGIDSLALITADDERITPEEPDEYTQPPLANITLAEGESILGLARFALPEDAIASFLEWCPDAACELQLRSPIP